MARSGREYRDQSITRKNERVKRGFSTDRDHGHQPPVRFRTPDVTAKAGRPRVYGQAA